MDDPNVLESTTTKTLPLAEPAGEEKPEPEGTQEIAGKKVVPLAALHEEREKRKELSAKIKDLEEKAKRVDQVEAHLQTVEPYIKVLADHPDVVENLLHPKVKEEPDDPEVAEFAREYGFYTEDGDLDLPRAKRAIERIETRVLKATDKKIDERINPIRENTMSAQAKTLRQRALQARDDSGRLIAKRETIEKVLDNLSPEQASSEDAVRWALVVARGLDGGAGPEEGSEPLYTEPAGGRGAVPRSLSTLEIAAAKVRGMSEEKFRKLADNKSEVLE